MIPINDSNTLWYSVAQETRDGERQSASLSESPDSDGPVCCWNLCPNISSAKTPRQGFAAATESKNPVSEIPGLGRLSSAAVFSGLPFLPEPKSVGASVQTADYVPHAPWPYQHLSRRLLMEPVGPDQHLVFNPLSGAVDLFSREEWAAIERLQRGHTALLAPAQERRLRERGYLFDNAAAEEECLEKAVGEAWERMQHRQPESYTVCPTLACNLACAYCFEGDSLQDKPQGVMTDQQVEELFAAIAEIRRGAAQEDTESPYAPWICLFGGEPLLPSTKRCVAQILRLAAENGFLVGATTNGVNLIRYADLLRKYADILTTFQITLDGPQAVHDSRRHRLGGQGTFTEIVQGIDLLLSLGIDVDVRVNLDATNLAALPGLVDFIFEKGWNAQSGFKLALAPVTQHGTGSGKTSACGEKSASVLSEMELTQAVMGLLEAQTRLAQICHLGFLRHLSHLVSVLEPASSERSRTGSRRAGPRYWYCEASTDKQFVFTPEGLIYRCTEAVGKPRHAIGRFDPTLEIWQKETREWTGRTILSHSQCRSCSISTLCGGGCHFAARERQIVDSNSLLQIAMPRTLSKAYRYLVPGSAEVLSPNSDRTALTLPQAQGDHMAAPVQWIDPFCNAAEQTVRAYLRHIGQQMMADTQDPLRWSHQRGAVSKSETGISHPR